MPTMTTRPSDTPETLLLALDLGNTTWKLGFRSGGPAQPPRVRTMPARDLAALQREVAAAKQRFGLEPTAPVLSCYEAGRDGFWVHRALTSVGLTNLVVDSASIERSARGRQAKSDRLDTTALLDKLGRYASGEQRVWSVVHVPSLADDDRRQLHRELTTLTWERTRLVNRIRGVVAVAAAKRAKSSAKKSPSTTAGRKPTGMTLHVYNVGFGDCFLMTWHYASRRDRNVLIDFGSTGLPKGVPKNQMLLIAQDIATSCKNKLDAVVLTHRHRDHMSGFATNAKGTGPGDIIKGLKPDLVVQPWTEDPKAKRKATSATKTLTKNLAMVRALDEQRLATQNVAAEASAILAAIGDGPGRGKLLSASAEGMEGILNPEAVANLATMSPRHAYVNAGSTAGLARILPGVKVTVLGPPTLDQSKEIEHETAISEAEFWMLQARAGRYIPAATPTTTGHPLFPGAKTLDTNSSYAARWLIPKLRSIRGDELLGIVRILDAQMNNTSVILLFEVGKQRLLFPGDAQLENWNFTLKNASLMTRLKGVTFYKVGHHGSRNATPKSLWNGFSLKSTSASGKRLKTVVSTKAGKFKGTKGKNTEVPRKTLITALAENSEFFSTQELTPATGTLKKEIQFSF